MKNAENPLIFLVEENQIYADLIVSYLTERKFKNLRTFKNGPECLKFIHLKPDIIILDFSSEGIPWQDFMEKVKKIKEDVVFIFLSAHDNVEYAVQTMRHGAFDYIVKKDRTPERLVKSIGHAMAQTKKTRLTKGLRLGLIGFFALLLFIILVVVGLMYYLKW